MDDTERQSKQRLIEVLLIISGFLIAIKATSEIGTYSYLFALFLVFSLVYYIVISKPIPIPTKHFKVSVFISSLAVSVLFSLLMAIAIGITAPSEPLSIPYTFFWYYILVPILLLSLNDGSLNNDIETKLKKVILRK